MMGDRAAQVVGDPIAAGLQPTETKARQGWIGARRRESSLGSTFDPRDRLLDGGDEIADSLGPLQPHDVIQEVVELGFGL